jgi:hypothetical protein
MPNPAGQLPQLYWDVVSTVRFDSTPGPTKLGFAATATRVNLATTDLTLIHVSSLSLHLPAGKVQHLSDNPVFTGAKGLYFAHRKNHSWRGRGEGVAPQVILVVVPLASVCFTPSGGVG